MPKKGKKSIATKSIISILRRSTGQKQTSNSGHESDYEYAQHMQQKFRQVNQQRLGTEQLAKIPQLLKQSGRKLKKGITQAEQQSIEQEICRIDPIITDAEAHGGLFAISNPVARRRIYTIGFSNSI
ncbi:MAG: hypothetical protein EZS28_031913 [Streblomastix strix]|uniref:Uncharacterized protein n=1 Tax=Streblomastix strix TaxID=222440 RepID=A0A5J4UR26_9EUKA|nr:MAG: hypothetical protein EZS28_031913 [Streblomastix strix]